MAVNNRSLQVFSETLIQERVVVAGPNARGPCDYTVAEAMKPGFLNLAPPGSARRVEMYQRVSVLTKDAGWVDLQVVDIADNAARIITLAPLVGSGLVGGSVTLADLDELTDRLDALEDRKTSPVTKTPAKVPVTKE